MSATNELLFTEDHEWVRVEDEKTADGLSIAYVGITEFAQGELGDIVYIEIETEGATFSQNEVFGTVEAVKTVSDLFMPVDGKILEVNKELADRPELVNEEPHFRGWMIKIEISDDTQLEGLMSKEDYDQHTGA